MSDAEATLTVPADAAGESLLEFLSLRLLSESKTRLRRAIASGRIRLNGSAVSTGTALKPKDVIALPAGMGPSPPPQQVLPIEVLYEDEDHLCVNKPPGHPVLPTRAGGGHEFHDSLIAYVNRDAPPGGPYRRPHLVHRLDRETSGALLVAKNVEAGRALSKQFQQRKVAKTYLAIIEGVLPRAELDLEIPVAQEAGSVLKMRPDQRRGKPARSRLRVREEFGHFCLLEVRALTGRQHQIRVHLAAIGYPLAVDGLYGRREKLTAAEFNAILGRRAADPGRVLLPRCPLHAIAVGYTHPGSGEPMCHHAPLPEDMDGFLQVLRRVDGAARPG
ncbi:MAG: RluA family pseudouridine synthase [Planctomycetota bacterium]|jgi:23S rRNA pseudouridine1911/1915/1917 synthase